MHLTRRYFLQSTGAALTYLGVAPAFSAPVLAGIRPRAVRAGRTLVCIFLRGGADGLNLVVPHAEDHYYTLRRSLAVPRPGTAAGEAGAGAIDLDGRFGLNPRLSALKPLFDDGLAVAAHAVGYDRNTRSHFEEQDTWETGVAGNTINSDGWLNRHLATSTGKEGAVLRAVSVGDTLPRIMQGKASAFAVRGLDDLTLPASRRVDPATVAAALERAYGVSAADAGERAAATDLLAQTAGATLDGLDQLRTVTQQQYTPAVEYPRTPLAEKLKQVARLIKADLGLEVVEVSLGGWDTHQNQGRGGMGVFGDLTQQFGDAVAAFTRDLGDRMDDVLVATLTDFGRTAAENGTAGTDHGWANCMFLVGGAVQRGHAAARAGGNSLPRKVVAKWPGLAPDQLHERRDLLHTTDFRDVLGEVVGTFLGNENIKAVLPRHEFKGVGLVA
ncbi:MAG: DUF1501 domain-containing protein [Phycisphaeraceae bacterium]|nr:DUF1501 domain-containing protein [Phycisphaeraceae bacterium]